MLLHTCHRASPCADISYPFRAPEFQVYKAGVKYYIILKHNLIKSSENLRILKPTETIFVFNFQRRNRNNPDEFAVPLHKI